MPRGKSFRQREIAYRNRAKGRGTTDALVRFLGWFSIGLGAAELIMPRTLTRTLGMKGSERLVQAYGAREMGTGLAILYSADPTPYVLGRVAGDAVDIATLATAVDRRNPKRDNVGIAIAAVIGVTILDVIAAQALARRKPLVSIPRLRNYRNRTGWNQPIEAMRGAASDFVAPKDFRTPELLRPWTN